MSDHTPLEVERWPCAWPGRPPDPGTYNAPKGGAGYRSRQRGSIIDVPSHTYRTSRE